MQHYPPASAPYTSPNPSALFGQHSGGSHYTVPYSQTGGSDSRDRKPEGGGQVDRGTGPGPDQPA